MPNIRPEEYEYLWSNSDVNYLFTSCYLSPVFRAADIVLTYDWKARELKYFLGKEDHKRISEETALFYQDELRFGTWKGEIEQAIADGRQLVAETDEEKGHTRDVSDKELVARFKARVELFQRLCDLYFCTEFFSVDVAERLVEVDPKRYAGVHTRLAEMGEIKFKARGVLNEFYNYRRIFAPYAEEIARRRDRSDIEWLSHEEIIAVATGEEVPVSGRASNYWLLAKQLNWTPVYGTEAKVVLDTFDDSFFKSQITEIKGTIASKGVYRGTAKVLRTIFSDAVTDEIRKVEKGDVLVANTTGPEVMAACERAGAIVTDEGGLTSHAAIVSRELKIPCIVGTKIGSKVFKDGDLIEVDADRGMVRKI